MMNMEYIPRQEHSPTELLTHIPGFARLSSAGSVIAGAGRKRGIKKKTCEIAYFSRAGIEIEI